MKKSLSLLGPPECVNYRGDLEKQMNVDIIISEHPEGLVTRNHIFYRMEENHEQNN